MPTNGKSYNVIQVEGLQEALAQDFPTKRRMLKTTDATERLNDAAHNAKAQGKRDVVISLIRRAVALKNDSWFLNNALATALWDNGQYHEADQCVMKALAEQPRNAEVLANAGSIGTALKKWHRAREQFDLAVQLAPDNQGIAWNRAIGILASGEWKAGFEAAEVRIKYKCDAFLAMPYPQWDGSDLNGKVIYIAGEQGMGDRVLFSRYLYWLKKKYPDVKILFMASSGSIPDMVPLFWSFKEIVEFVPVGIPWPRADFGLYLGSLPRFHGTTPDNVPPDPGYIRQRAESDRHEARLPPPRVRALKVGITWTGQPEMARNSQRSVPFVELMRLMENPQVQLYSFQGPPGNQELYNTDPQTDLVYDCWPAIARVGAVGTAAALLDCDLVITSCTFVAHLAGALGLPTWTLLSYDPYWAWGRDEHKTPWYPSMRLYRQPRPKDWGAVFAEVKRDLAKLAQVKLSRHEEEDLPAHTPQSRLGNGPAQGVSPPASPVQGA